MQATAETVSSDKPGTGDRLVQVTRVMRVLMDGRFTGYLKINFSRGAIAKLEKFEEILKGK